MKLPEIRIVGSGVWKNHRKYVKTSARFVLTYELEFHKATCGNTSINGKEYPVERGTVTFNRPGDIRSTRFTEGCEVRTEFIYFLLELGEGMGAFDAVIRQVPSHVRADEGIGRIWEDLFSHCEDMQTGFNEALVYSELLLLLTLLANENRTNTDIDITCAGAVPQQTLFEAIRYMNEHLRDNLSVYDVAAHLGYSPSHFNHMFKTYTRHTPHSYYVSLKISEAKYMLLNTEKSIAQISDELGFCKPDKFREAFKKECHVTPGEFRKSRDATIYGG